MCGGKGLCGTLPKFSLQQRPRPIASRGRFASGAGETATVCAECVAHLQFARNMHALNGVYSCDWAARLSHGGAPRGSDRAVGASGGPDSGPRCRVSALLGTDPSAGWPRLRRPAARALPPPFSSLPLAKHPTPALCRRNAVAALDRVSVQKVRGPPTGETVVSVAQNDLG